MVEVPDKNAPFRAAIDSTAMLTLARFGMPIVVAALGALLMYTLNDLKTGQRDGLSELKTGQQQVWLQISKMTDAQATTNAMQSGLSVKVDAAVKQIDHLQVQVDNLPKVIPRP